MANNIIKFNSFHLGPFYIDPAKNIIQSTDGPKHIQPKLMEVLTYLCQHQGRIVSAEELINECWPDQFIGDNPVHKCIAQLRKALGDTSKNSNYISTTPKRGYSVVSKVTGIATEQINITPFWLDGSPYVGLKSYQQEHKELFFGREQNINDVISLVTNINDNQVPWLNIIGSAGCGKTSLIQAGVIPQLLQLNVKPEPPSTSLPQVKNHYIKSYNFSLVEPTVKINVSLNLLQFLIDHKILSNQLSISDYVEMVSDNKKVISSQIEKLAAFIRPEVLKHTQKNNQIILFIDHIELLLLSKYEALDLVLFFNIISALIHSKKCLLITEITQISYQQLLELKIDIVNRLELNYILHDLNHSEFIDIITKPAQAAGLTFEYNKEKRETLASYLNQKLQISSVPISIIQSILSGLYQQKTERTLTFSAFDNMGGIEGTLATLAEHNYQVLTQQQQSSFNALLFSLITVDSDNPEQVRAQQSILNKQNNKNIQLVISSFVKCGILKYDTTVNGIVIVFSHVSLLSHWPRISSWVDQNIRLLYLRHDIRLATERWLYNNKNQDFLFNATQPLKQMNNISSNSYIIMTADEQEFIRRSTTKFSTFNKIKIIIIAILCTSFISLSWLNISIIKKNKEITETKNNSENLISFILYDLKDKLEPLGQLELLNLVGAKTSDYFALAGTENLSGKSLKQWIDALHILGEVNVNKNNYQQAKVYFQQSKLALTQALSKDFNDIKLLEQNMFNSYWLGYVSYIQKNYIYSKPHFQNYLAQSNKLISLEPKNQDWLLEKSYALNNLGSLAEKTNKLDIASDYFKKSSAIKKQLLLIQSDNLVIRRDLADTLSWQGTIQQEKGQLLLALNFYQQALAQINTIHNSHKKNYKIIQAMANLNDQIAFCYYNMGDLNNALTYSKNTQNLLDQLIDHDVENYDFKKRILWNYLLLASIHRNLGNSDQGFLYLDKSNTLISTFRDTSKYSHEIKVLHINVLHEKAKLLNIGQQKKSALFSINKALSLFNKELSQEKNSIIYAELVLNKSKIVNHLLEEKNSFLLNEINKVILLLQPKIDHLNYKETALYLSILQDSGQLMLNNKWLIKYMDSDYNIPDFPLRIKSKN